MLTEDKIKEYIFLAHQSGKQETSNLVTDLTYKVTEAVKEQVIITVNGKISEIKKHLEKQDVLLLEMDKKISQIKIDTDPIVETKKSFTILGKLVVWVSVVCGAIAGLYKILKL